MKTTMQSLKACLLFILICRSFFVDAQVTFQPVPGSPFAAGTNSVSVAFSPEVSGKLFAAVANISDNDVSVYSVDETTGIFTPVSGSPFSAGRGPVSVAFSPEVSGKLFAAVANISDNDVSVYSVDETTGIFTPVLGSPFPAGRVPQSVAFSPDVSGKLFAAVANLADGNVSVYSVDETTGIFTPVLGSPFSSGIFPISVAFSPDISGKLFAAVANLNDSNVSVYSVDETTGIFTPVSGSPFSSGNSPVSVAFSPDISGKLFAAVANINDSDVSVYSVDETTGLFTPVSGSPFSSGTNPSSVAFSPDLLGNLFAAVTNLSDDNVSIYLVDQTTGAFTQVLGSPFATGSIPESVAFSPDVSGNLFAAVANETSNNVSVFQVLLPPTVTGVSPNMGPFSGGTSVMITGTSFTPSATVQFGSTPSTSVMFVSSTELIAISPAGSGMVDVTVTTAGGTSLTSPADQFTYIPSPTVTGVSPNMGPSSGGTSVMITGTNFIPSATVQFGSTPSPSVTFVSSTELIAISPAGSGTVDVTVTTAGGTSATSPADQFTYISAPTVTGVSPTTGPSSGGTSVTITGTNFTPSATVKFGATPSPSVTFVSSTELIAISPAGSGTVDVKVTTAGGTSATSPADQFTYLQPVPPPKHVRGHQVRNQFATQEDIINVITWRASSQGVPLVPVAYKIFKNVDLTQLIGVVGAHPHQDKFRFNIHHRKKDHIYTYYLVSVDEMGRLSVPVKVKIKSK